MQLVYQSTRYPPKDMVDLPLAQLMCGKNECCGSMWSHANLMLRLRKVYGTVRPLQNFEGRMLVLHAPCSQGYLTLYVLCLIQEMILHPNPKFNEGAEYSIRMR